MVVVLYKRWKISVIKFCNVILSWGRSSSWKPSCHCPNHKRSNFLRFRISIQSKQFPHLILCIRHKSSIHLVNCLHIHLIGLLFFLPFIHTFIQRNISSRIISVSTLQWVSKWNLIINKLIFVYDLVTVNACAEWDGIASWMDVLPLLMEIFVQRISFLVKFLWSL